MLVATETMSSSYIYNDNGGQRTEKRIPLALPIYVRRPINNSFYRRQVFTTNVSRRGVCIISEVKLEVGAKLEIFAFNDRFYATAVVCHAKMENDGRWALGIKFLKMTGCWVSN